VVECVNGASVESVLTTASPTALASGSHNLSDLNAAQSATLGGRNRPYCLHDRDDGHREHRTGHLGLVTFGL
jgi:hypothetical protein